MEESSVRQLRSAVNKQRAVVRISISSPRPGLVHVSGCAYRIRGLNDRPPIPFRASYVSRAFSHA
jgi:hypothetical protein